MFPLCELNGISLCARQLVTAAHCVRNKKIINVRVSLGMVNLFGPPNEFEQVLRVDKFDMHDGSYITSDIAVITMATPAKLNKNVKVCACDYLFIICAYLFIAYTYMYAFLG